MSQPVPLSHYSEKLRFRVSCPGTEREYRALLPSEVDLRVLNQRIATQKEELERLETQPEPKEVRDARKALPELAPEEKASPSPAYTLALEKVRADDSRKLWEQEGYQANLWRTQKQLQRAIDLIDSEPPEDATEEVREFLFREMEYEERLAAEEKTTTLNPETNQKEPDQNRRDLLLMQAVFLGEKVEGELRHCDPGKLEPVIYTTLASRVWAHTNRDPNLVDYFRGGGPDARGNGVGGP